MVRPSITRKKGQACERARRWAGSTLRWHFREQVVGALEAYLYVSFDGTEDVCRRAAQLAALIGTAVMLDVVERRGEA